MNADTLEKIAEEVRGCPLCDLSKSRKNAVPGEGRIGARILFIGEAPGKNEDDKGRPFVGAAGRILDNALEKAGIPRSDVYITNVVKCRPPGNRIPENDEITACMPYLERQIALINPDIICILGRTALNSLLGDSSARVGRGKIVKKDGRKYFVSFHPAAAIYNRNLLPILEKDIQKLADTLKRFASRPNSNMEDFI